ncbi:hypothetical protein, partial [Sphingomonas sp.]|uniref:hypothetical protein n=1 Tax=Sphingomonas sp. TaxID=28214 RepID=UPI0035AD9E7E
MKTMQQPGIVCPRPRRTFLRGLQGTAVIALAMAPMLAQAQDQSQAAASQDASAGSAGSSDIVVTALK